MIMGDMSETFQILQEYRIKLIFLKVVETSLPQTETSYEVSWTQFDSICKKIEKKKSYRYWEIEEYTSMEWLR